MSKRFAEPLPPIVRARAVPSGCVLVVPGTATPLTDIRCIGAGSTGAMAQAPAVHARPIQSRPFRPAG